MRISDWSTDVCSSDLSPEIEAAAEDDDRDDVQYGPDDLHRHAAIIAEMQRLRDEECGVVPLGRASRRERVCQYVLLSVVAVSLTHKILNKKSLYTQLDSKY